MEVQGKLSASVAQPSRPAIGSQRGGRCSAAVNVHADAFAIA